MITHIDKGFDFLGQNVRKYHGKLLIKPARKNLKTFLAKIRDFLNANKTMPAWWVVSKLNPMIRGWVNYHKSVVAADTFKYVDYRIWKMLWQWCKRRHLKRRRRWVKVKYFKSVANRNWVFHGYAPDGKQYLLLYAAETAIKRHVKIKAEANPYLPEYESYFEKRLERAWRDSMSGKRKINSLWVRQLGKCPMCEQSISQETGWNIHHILERHKGGSDSLDNLMLLHPNCHRQLHAKSCI